MFIFRLLALASLCLANTTVKLLSRDYHGSSTYMLSNASDIYYVRSSRDVAPVGIYAIADVQDGLVPFTVITSDVTNITAGTLSDKIHVYAQDDVWKEEFLSGIVLVSTAPSTVLDASGLAYLHSICTSVLLIDDTISTPDAKITTFTKSISTPPPGPYLGEITSGQLILSETYATFRDGYSSFMSGVTRNDDGSYSPLEFWHPSSFEKLIPFPSRLYSSLLPRSTYPLAGLRFAIKDIVDLAGIVTGGGSTDYMRLYSTPKVKTAPAMQRLIDLGATPIGKTKSATFAWGAWPDQNDDVPYPWNPRADGYLGLSASSHGSASAIGAYDLLDFVIGTDTGGSVRNPADRVGVYGLRPTWGVVDVEGVIESAKTLDSVGFLTRDPILAHQLTRLWFGDGNPALKAGSFDYPKKIIYPSEWFPLNSSTAQDLVDSWLANMTSALGMKIEYQNTSNIFQDVIGYNGTLGDWTSNVSSVNVKDNWDTLGRQFVEDYGKVNGGRYPTRLDAPVRDAWAQSPDYTQEYYETNVNRSWEFTSFWNEHIIPFNNATCSEGLWVYHIADTGGGVPEYRDRTLDYFPDFPGAMRGASIAPFAHTVDITIPIGQVPYDSVISKVEEQLAITLNFVAHRGCDAALMEFVKACADAGWCKHVQTGRTAF
ncbi:amidase signature domain-containing protein [Lophiotrema nucula]|uniref:Amidase signature domain-containing protein n=1 Tax=Lophiotrema nucula TaxID=690887 RepID=A0A6A5ZI23_9PLEO|nr:amidase signature domain-containing protein [Lophiotrema nucula]